MEFNELRKNIANFGAELRNSTAKHITLDFLEVQFKKISSFFRITCDNSNTKYAHYIDHCFTIHIYKTKINYEKYIHSEIITININEMFGNCSTVMINNLNTSLISTVNLLDVINIFEKLIEAFGYTCIMFNLSNHNNCNVLIEDLIKSKKLKYDEILKFKNKRGGVITYYSKLI